MELLWAYNTHRCSGEHQTERFHTPPLLSKAYHGRESVSRRPILVSQQNEKFLIEQSRKFLLTAARLEGWNDSTWGKRNWAS